MSSSNFDKYSEQSGKYISLLYRKTAELFFAKFEGKITPIQSVILVGIYRNPGVNQTFLTKSLHIDKSTMSRSLKILEDKKLISRTIDESNRRNYILNLTKDGESIVDFSRGVQMEVWNDVFSEFSYEKLLQFSEMLEKAYENLIDLY